MDTSALSMLAHENRNRDSEELPIFAEGRYENIRIALKRGIFDRAAYFFATDLKKIGYIDSDFQLHITGGDSALSVQRVKALPEAEDASDSVIYIFNNTAYLYNDGMYDPIAKDYTSELEDIRFDIEGIKTRLEDVEKNSGQNITEAASISHFPAIGKINHLYVSLKENASYRWDPENLKYKCVGRDYTSIKQINGGSADAEPININ